MNSTLKEATVNTFYYASHDKLKQHLHAYLMVYCLPLAYSLLTLWHTGLLKRLKAIKGKTLLKTQKQSKAKKLLGNSFKSVDNSS